MANIFGLFLWMWFITKGFSTYIFFIITWLAWEHSYFTWAVNWPWLVLGNSFATSIKSIQWYEYTGTLGGSLWILMANTLLFRIIHLKLRGERVRVSIISLAAIIIIPIVASHFIYYNYKEIENKREFTVLQPNIDPFNDKFGGLTQQDQDRKLIKLLTKSNNGRDRVILAPETFICTRLNEDNPLLNTSLSNFYNIIKDYNSLDSIGNGSNVNMIIGAVTYKMYSSSIDPTETATNIGDNKWYDQFNTAIFMDSRGAYNFYHKSKLVILAESNPFRKGPLKFIDKLVSGMAGGIGNFGTQPQRSIFITPNSSDNAKKNSVKMGTAICYESIFGDYYREYVLKGANVMGIITNDGWWKNTAGHKQH
ncbi:MAG: apolipoprotein N-acyltransferase, partial [Bacteroidales bacterium]